jgi:hypothetical protein
LCASGTPINDLEGKKFIVGDDFCQQSRRGPWRRSSCWFFTENGSKWPGIFSIDRGIYNESLIESGAAISRIFDKKSLSKPLFVIVKQQGDRRSTTLAPA